MFFKMAQSTMQFSQPECDGMVARQFFVDMVIDNIDTIYLTHFSASPDHQN